MSWNIELLVISPQLEDFDQISLIDIATKKADGIPFWDATSYSSIVEGLAIGNFDNKTILIDPSCRLSNAISHLISDLKNNEVLFSRVANVNICQYFINAKEQKPSFFKSFFSKKTVDNIDGEIEAWNYIEEKTGLKAGADNKTSDLNNSTYSLYVLE